MWRSTGASTQFLKHASRGIGRVHAARRPSPAMGRMPNRYMSSAKPPPPQGPPPPNARKPGDPLNSGAGNRTSAAKPEPTAEKAGSKAEGASADAGATTGAQAEQQASTGARQGSKASSSASDGASASAESQSATSGAKASSEQGSSAAGKGQRKGTRTTASAEKEPPTEGGSGGGSGGNGGNGGGDGDGVRSRFADAWNSAKEAANEAPQPEPPKKGSSLMRLLFGTTVLGGAGVGYIGYLYSTDANTVRQLMESKSPLVPFFETLGVPAAVKGPEFTISRANLLHRIHAKLHAAGGGAVSMDEATDVICALNPELDREQVQRVLQRRSQSRDGPVPQGAFVAVGRDALRGVEDHDLFKKSKDNFEVQPISEEMYSLLGSLFNTFKGAEDNAISVGDVKDFSAKLDLGGDETAGRLVESVDMPQTDVSGMGKEDFVNLIALLLIDVPENRRIEKLEQQLKLYRIHQRERQRALERASELAEEDAERIDTDPFAAMEQQRVQEEREGKEQAAAAAASAPMASAQRQRAAPSPLAGIPLFDNSSSNTEAEAPAEAPAVTAPAVPELETGVSSVPGLRHRLKALREEEASYLHNLPGGKPAAEQEKEQAAAYRDAKHRVKQRIKEVEEEAKAASAARP